VTLVKGAPDDPLEPARKVVVPVVGAWEHAVEHACKLIHGEDALVSVVYLISVPRSEAIDTPKPDDEAAASDCRSEAARIGRKYGVTTETSIERVRDPVLGFLRLFESEGFDLAVVGMTRETTGDYHIGQAIAASLLQETPCETALLRVGDSEPQ